MVNFPAKDLVLIGRVKAIALGEPMLKRTFLAQAYFGSRTVASVKFRGTAQTARGIMNAFAILLRTHRCLKIGQMIKPAGSPDCRKIGRVEAEEINSRLASKVYIGADIQLRESREAGERRQPANSNSAHAKGNDSKPALAIEGVERELYGDQRSHGNCGNRPVRKQQIVPDLLHQPWARRQRPRTMFNRLEQQVHQTVYPQRTEYHRKKMDCASSA